MADKPGIADIIDETDNKNRKIDKSSNDLDDPDLNIADVDNINNLGMTNIVDANKENDPNTSITDIDEANNLGIANVADNIDNKTDKIDRNLNDHDW